jgi:RNA polymerase sigma factor (sigma-70 family)
MTTDPELLRRFVQANDQEAFGELVQRQVNLVYSAALRQVGGDDHLARDVTQGVFLALARGASSLQGHATLEGWLYVTTRFVSAKAVRSHRRWRQRAQEAQSMRTIDSTGAAEPSWDQLRPVLDHAMYQLSASDREAVILRYFENLPFAEIGARCALSENSARMRVDRALEKLRQQLAKKGVTSTAGALSAALSAHAVAAAPAGLATAAATAALAGLGAGGAGAGALHYLISMSTTKITIGLTGLLCLLAVGTASYETLAARRAEADLAVTRQASDALALAHRDDSVRIRALQSQLAAALAAGNTADAAAAAGRAGAGPHGEAAGGGAAHRAAMIEALNSPQLEMTAKLQLDNQFAALFKGLGLTAEQTEQFRNLLLAKRAALIDAMSAAQEQGIDPSADPRSFYLAVVAAENPVNAQISALLGPANYGQYQQYMQSLPAMTTSHLLQQTLSYSAAPLTDAQVSGLSQVLAQYSPPSVPEPFALLNGDLGVTTFTPQALAAVQELLSAPQLKALQDQIAQQHGLLMARQQMK